MSSEIFESQDVLDVAESFFVKQLKLGKIEYKELVRVVLQRVLIVFIDHPFEYTCSEFNIAIAFLLSVAKHVFKALFQRIPVVGKHRRFRLSQHPPVLGVFSFERRGIERVENRGNEMVHLGPGSVVLNV